MTERIGAVTGKDNVVPTGIDGVDALVELALDLRSSWNHGADALWNALDSELWVATRNPWAVLQTVSRDRLRGLLGDTTFRRRLNETLRRRRKTLEAPAWFQRTHPGSALRAVAYFSMEFMLSEALPIYSGGLGNVAGDQLKAADDLGVPVHGVGLLYQQGYFRQVIDSDGRQRAVYPYNDPGQLPITPLRDAGGEWLRLALELPGHRIWVRAWQAQVGRLRLYLLDTNDVANHPPYRGITSELYGGGAELRLLQEFVLGIGGWRLLRTLGIEPEVCHLNEGHAALAVLERARDVMTRTGQPFDVALSITRAGNLFTTHTAVDAGFDRFDPALVEHYLGSYAREQLGISVQDLLALGRVDPDDAAATFNMTYLAIRGSAAVNGVSRLHGRVSRRLFAPLFARWPVHEVPITHVTNGVHVPTWDSAAADALWTRTCGKSRWLGETEPLGQPICCLSDAELWRFRCEASESLVDFVRQRVAAQAAANGAFAAEADGILDAGALTIVFARRFASYKRPDLLLHEPPRLLRLLGDRERPVQLVLAGKAHPADPTGQQLIQRWTEFARHPEVRHRVAFLGDYDMHVAEHLVQGADLWLNTPRRPWEASGTSGMKVLVNGGINLSVRDGWWAEAYTPDVGWALGDESHDDSGPMDDAAEANALYALLEQRVVPEFFDRDEKGIPCAWVARMRQSMGRLTPYFSTNRVVREYTEHHYLPAAESYRARVTEDGALGADIVHRLRGMRRHWGTMHIEATTVRTFDGNHHFEVTVDFGELDPAELQVELYADGSDANSPARLPMTRKHALDRTNTVAFETAVPATRAAEDFTARVIPGCRGVTVPLEAPWILWQR